jgi:hypothetical protein
MTEENKASEAGGKEVTEENQKPEKVSWLERIEKADTPALVQGVLTDLMDPSANDELEQDAYRVLSETFGRALNKHDCPCGSGKALKECCKPVWNTVRRVYEGRASRRRVEEKTRKRAEEMPGVEWVLEIGMRKDGGTVIRPKSDQHHPTINDVVGILMGGWLDAFSQMMMEATRAQTMNILQNVLGGTKPANPKQGGNLVVVPGGKEEDESGQEETRQEEAEGSTGVPEDAG